MTVLTAASEEKTVGIPTAAILSGLSGSLELKKPAIVDLKVKADYLSCPSLRSAINILKQDNNENKQPITQLLGAFEQINAFEKKYNLRSLTLNPKLPVSKANPLAAEATESTIPALMAGPPSPMAAPPAPETIYVKIIEKEETNEENKKKKEMKEQGLYKEEENKKKKKKEKDEEGLYYEIFDEKANCSHIGLINWMELPSTFSRDILPIIVSPNEILPIVLARTPLGAATLSIDDVISLFKEFDKHILEKKKQAKAEATTMDSKKSKAYLKKAKKLREAEKLVFEQTRAYLMQLVLEKLKNDTDVIQPTKAENLETPSTDSFWTWAQFAALMLVEFAPMFVMNLMYAGESLASLSPYLFFLSPHVMTALGVLCALNMVGGAVFFVGPIIMKWLGLNYSKTEPALHSVYQQQLEASKDLDNCLSKNNKLSHESYNAYLNFSKIQGEYMQKIPSQKKDERLIAKVSTWGMTAIAGLQALSGSIFLGASILGLVFGAFTLTTSTPLILTAFVANHLIAVLLVSTPLAISQGLVSYILRVTSASKLFDLDKDEREAVEKNRIEYCLNKPNIQTQLNKHGWDKKVYEHTIDKIQPEVQATDLFTEIKNRVKKLDAADSPESKKRAQLSQEKAARKPHKTAIRKPHEKMFKPILLDIQNPNAKANLKTKLKALSSHVEQPTTSFVALKRYR